MKKPVLFAFVLLLTFTLVIPVCLADINDDLFQAIKNKDIQKAKRLLSEGADANAKKKGILGDNTPLASAIFNGAPEIAKLLIEKGANVNLKDSMTGDTPLTDAAMQGYTEVVKLLLEKGADVHVKNVAGYTALMLAAIGGRNEIMKSLIEKGSNVNDKADDGLGSTPLHLARCSTETVNLLITKGADVNAKDKNGKTPLMSSASRCPAEIASLLISKGANVNAKDRNGATPLMYSSRSPVEVAKALITAGADVNAKNNNGNTALYAAEANGNSDMIKLLKQMGGQGGKLPEQVPSTLTAADADFLLRQCLLEQSDIDAIPKLEKGIQKLLFSRIALRDCKLLAGFKASRNYYRQLKPNSKIPLPPAGWDSHYLTDEEFDRYKKILDDAPW
jgi:ankyrin repeat protein